MKMICKPIVAVLAALALCAAPRAQADDLVDTAVNAGHFKILVAAVKAAGLVDTLKGDGPFTVFAPTDEAFARLGHETINNLLKPENRKTLTAILTYHVLPNEVLGANVARLKNRTQVTTVNGAKVTIRNRNGLKVDDANIIKTDFLTDNGVIHVIDAVLMPNKGHSRAAIHEPEQPALDDIVDTAVKAGSFRTLIAAVKAAGLVDTLKGSGPFTLFAPTDAAFARIPRHTLQRLLRPENREKLTALLTYHVVPGKVLAADAKRLPYGARVKTVNGVRLTVRNSHGLKVDNANVVKTDILTSNGVIHVIDSVLIPQIADLDD